MSASLPARSKTASAFTGKLYRDLDHVLRAFGAASAAGLPVHETHCYGLRHCAPVSALRMIIGDNALGMAPALRCEFCVVGAGPAGIATALALSSAGAEVVLVESGADRGICDAQKLSAAVIVNPQSHADMEISVRRRLGGTSSLWGGRCLPLDAVDFAERRHVDGPGWPMDLKELQPWYERACRFAFAGPADFNPLTAIRSHQPGVVPGLEADPVLANSLERWSYPADFGREYRSELASRSNLRVLTGFTCVELAQDGADESVSGASLKALGGRHLTVHARHYILAAGGVETVRLLLNGNRRHPQGIGNSEDLLGRYYMGHISGKIAAIRFRTPQQATISGFERDTEGVYCRKRIAITEQAQQEHSLLNCAFWLDNPPPANAAHRNGILSAAYLALSAPGLSRFLAAEAIRRSLVDHPARTGLGSHLRNVLVDLPATAGYMVPFVARRYFGKRRLPGFFLHSRSNVYALHYHGEQAPDPRSRILLDDSQDALGVRRARIALRFGPQDYESIMNSHRILDQRLRVLGIGELDYNCDDPLESIRQQARDGFHQMGGARMARRPQDGVVDENCRLHAVPNLHVASSAVFPTSGQANPTLTIIALAMRLASRLAKAHGA